jgi:hypothetical protein
MIPTRTSETVVVAAPGTAFGQVYRNTGNTDNVPVAFVAPVGAIPGTFSVLALLEGSMDGLQWLNVAVSPVITSAANTTGSQSLQPVNISHIFNGHPGTGAYSFPFLRVRYDASGTGTATFITHLSY